jgi:hypothetical protein
LLRQAIELATEHFQHAWSVVPCRAARIEENVDAGAQSLCYDPRIMAIIGAVAIPPPAS